MSELKLSDAELKALNQLLSWVLNAGDRPNAQEINILRTILTKLTFDKPRSRPNVRPS